MGCGVSTAKDEKNVEPTDQTENDIVEAPIGKRLSFMEQKANVGMFFYKLF